MPDDYIVCNYVFTSNEFGKSLGGYWRMAKWWYLGLIFFMLMFPIYFTIFPDLPPPDTAPSLLWWTFFLNVIPFILILGLMGPFVYWQMRRAFVKGPSFNRQVTYTLRDIGIHVANPLLQADCTWQAFAHAGETQYGFYIFLLGKRSFHWLSKAGFSSTENIDQCRDLLQRHIKKFQGAKY